MIVFDLKCSNGHIFEGWFKDRKTFDRQNKKALITCPVCNDTSITKKLSAFSIKSSQPPQNYKEQDYKELEKTGEKIVDFIEKNFDDVGSDFASEALKMHYGVSEVRNIRGHSSSEEEKILSKEGVDFVKIPLPVIKNNDS